MIWIIEDNNNNQNRAEFLLQTMSLKNIKVKKIVLDVAFDIDTLQFLLNQL